MARLARLSIAGLPHLIDQRSVQGTDLFRDDDDRSRFLSVLHQACKAGSLALHGYVLLPDEFCLLATPEAPGAVARAMQAIGRRYVRHYNDRHRRKGPLFEGRFRSAVLDPERFMLPCLRYVESRVAPASHGEGTEQVLWSSFRHHAGFGHDPMIADGAVYWSLGNTPFERHGAWREFVSAGVPAAERTRIETALRGGWVIGGSDFAAQLHSAGGRRLVPGRPGRPPILRKPVPMSVPSQKKS
jgi:putative transposase